jgi:hypothetical protein
MVIRGNIVHDNGNITDTTGPRIAGDEAISIFDNNNILVEGNFIYNSARGAIGSSNTPNTYGHRIIGNVIYNWNLVGPACEAVASCENVRRSAIDLFGWGDTANSGWHTIWNNTIHSDQVENELFGIQLRTIWQSAHTLQDTSVLNNLISMPNNTHPGTFGMRMTQFRLSSALPARAGLDQTPAAAVIATADRIRGRIHCFMVRFLLVEHHCAACIQGAPSLRERGI